MALLGLACRDSAELIEEGSGDVVVTVSTPTPRPSPSPEPSPLPSPTPTATPEPVCKMNPDPAPPSLLQVQLPIPQQQVKNPLEVRGWGSTIGRDESGVAIAILKPDLTVFQPSVEVPPQTRVGRVPPPGLEITPHARPFAADIPFGGLTAPQPVCIWVYLDTAEDGTPKSVVQVPVVLVP